MKLFRGGDRNKFYYLLTEGKKGEGVKDSDPNNWLCSNSIATCNSSSLGTLSLFFNCYTQSPRVPFCSHAQESLFYYLNVNRKNQDLFAITLPCNAPNCILHFYCMFHGSPRHATLQTPYMEISNCRLTVTFLLLLLRLNLPLFYDTEIIKYKWHNTNAN